MATFCFEFTSIRKARDAVSQLKNMGYRCARLDAVDSIDLEEVIHQACMQHTSNDCFEFLLHKWVNTQRDESERSYAASSPSISGMGPYIDTHDPSATRLLVDADEDSVEELKEVLAAIMLS